MAEPTIPDEAVHALQGAIHRLGVVLDPTVIRAGLVAAYPHLAAQALRQAETPIRRIAIRLEAKGRGPDGDKHLGTALGVRLALVKLIELADEITRCDQSDGPGPHTEGVTDG